MSKGLRFKPLVANVFEVTGMKMTKNNLKAQSSLVYQMSKKQSDKII